MPKTGEYKLIEGGSMPAFISSVNTFLTQGYRPVGGVCVVHIPKIPNTNGDAKTMYYQALYKEA